MGVSHALVRVSPCSKSSSAACVAMVLAPRVALKPPTSLVEAMLHLSVMRIRIPLLSPPLLVRKRPLWLRHFLTNVNGDGEL